MTKRAVESGSERRQTFRQDMRIVCQAFIDEASGESCEMVTRDVSHTGAFFETGHSVDVSSKIKVMMDLGKHLVEIVGEVVRVEAEGFAVAFFQTQVVPIKI